MKSLINHWSVGKDWEQSLFDHFNGEPIGKAAFVPHGEICSPQVVVQAEMYSTIHRWILGGVRQAIGLAQIDKECIAAPYSYGVTLGDDIYIAIDAVHVAVAFFYHVAQVNSFAHFLCHHALYAIGHERAEIALGQTHCGFVNDCDRKVGFFAAFISHALHLHLCGKYTGVHPVCGSKFELGLVEGALF